MLIRFPLSAHGWERLRAEAPAGYCPRCTRNVPDVEVRQVKSDDPEIVRLFIDPSRALIDVCAQCGTALWAPDFSTCRFVDPH